VPTTTWQGLDPAKRERIAEAAMRELGARGFSSGSLNVVAREAGIAKGSLFVYFDDKLELFRHVCGRTSDRVREQMVARMVEVGIDQPFFALLRSLVEDWVGFFRDHPLELGVTLATNFEMDADVRATVRGVVPEGGSGVALDQRTHEEVVEAVRRMVDDLERAYGR
jgi:AcrR family transcriptional regulator